jgi:hypothetical protein
MFLVDVSRARLSLSMWNTFEEEEKLTFPFCISIIIIELNTLRSSTERRGRCI